ncbi:hypothetical protein AMECASPLE_038972 [Ameca splendens]|uniref:Uncharacterized protein n=1 Tax=Ameca splendens TaxID=208324 RepID=A0ABV0ZIW2_9TELE
MCKCCYTTSSGRVYTTDFEPVTNSKFDDDFEKNLTYVRQVKGKLSLLFAVLHLGGLFNFFNLKTSFISIKTLSVVGLYIFNGIIFRHNSIKIHLTNCIGKVF